MVTGLLPECIAWSEEFALNAPSVRWEQRGPVFLG